MLCILSFHVEQYVLQTFLPCLVVKERKTRYYSRENVLLWTKTNSIREWTCMWSSFELETFRDEPKMSITTHSTSRQQRLLSNKTSKKEIKGLLTTCSVVNQHLICTTREKTARLVLLFIWSQPCIVCMSSARIITPSHSMILASLFYKGMSE